MSYTAKTQSAHRQDGGLQTLTLVDAREIIAEFHLMIRRKTEEGLITVHTATARGFASLLGCRLLLELHQALKAAVEAVD